MNVSWRKGWYQATGGTTRYPWAEFANDEHRLVLARRSRILLDNPDRKRWALYYQHGVRVCEAETLRDIFLGWIEWKMKLAT